MQLLLEGGAVRSYGEVVLIVLGRGRGALVTTPFEYSSVRKWAENRTATGVEYRDMTLFMNRFDTCIARSGSALATKGHPVNLIQLGKAMKSAGLELSEWSFPKEVKEQLSPPRPGQQKTIEAEEEADEDGADDGDEVK